MNRSLIDDAVAVTSFEKVLTKLDLDKITALSNTIWNEYYIPIFGKEKVEYMLANFFSKKALLEKIKKYGYRYYLIKYKDQDVGYIGIKVRKKDVLIGNMYLRPKYRGLRIGREATRLAQSVGKQKGRKIVTIRVNKENLEAIVASYRLGFKKTGEVSRSIGGSYVMDDLIMELPVE